MVIGIMPSESAHHNVQVIRNISDTKYELEVTDVNGERYYFPVTKEGFRHYRNKTKTIQECFPELRASERELILTGIPADMWDDMFKEDE